jgi:hypothetical protein
MSVKRDLETVIADEVYAKLIAEGIITEEAFKNLCGTIVSERSKYRMKPKSEPKLSEKYLAFVDEQLANIEIEDDDTLDLYRFIGSILDGINEMWLAESGEEIGCKCKKGLEFDFACNFCMLRRQVYFSTKNELKAKKQAEADEEADEKADEDSEETEDVEYFSSHYSQVRDSDDESEAYDEDIVSDI